MEREQWLFRAFNQHPNAAFQPPYAFQVFDEANLAMNVFPIGQFGQPLPHPQPQHQPQLQPQPAPPQPQPQQQQQRAMEQQRFVLNQLLARQANVHYPINQPQPNVVRVMVPPQPRKPPPQEPGVKTECPVCYDQYKPSSYPKLGSCGHSICLSCEQRIRNHKCPFCNMEEAFKYSQRNYLAEQLIAEQIENNKKYQEELNKKEKELMGEKERLQSCKDQIDQLNAQIFSMKNTVKVEEPDEDELEVGNQPLRRRFKRKLQLEEAGPAKRSNREVEVKEEEVEIGENEEKDKEQEEEEEEEENGEDGEEEEEEEDILEQDLSEEAEDGNDSDVIETDISVGSNSTIVINDDD